MMLRAENYVYFLTVSGFFIGTVFSILNFDAVEEILMYTFYITFFFYLFSHIALTYFVNFGSFKKVVFNKEKYERVADFFIKDIKIREESIKRTIADINELYAEIDTTEGLRRAS